ncbi:hypothetical protein [Yoonia vestfoldensis]|jgi:hypothetical protein|uniref:Uncharacterized protein n=1 Tax=Yoonia vestfoldensis TaxID=245188 RepID=A0A1Y0E987_9RHOB|nr:hypothetical protein [Yoonia vestfoldensis]ARU00177.1 hypothetical protein LOKVESSMR4R_00844 [Yoonia vestfoldensis]
MSDTNYKVQLEHTLDQISAARAVWEEGTLKSSNDELYAILERCFEIYKEMKEDTAKRRSLNSLLTDRNMKPRTSTSLGLKVIRYVFGKEGNREAAYAKLLSVAYDLKPTEQSLSSYIQECGGVEEVRRTSKIKDGTAMTAEDYRKMALEGLSMARIAVASFNLPEFIQPNREYDEDYVVGLIRCNTNGTGDLLFGNNDAKVIDTVLVASGKYLDQKAQDDQKGLEAADVAKRRTEDVKTFAPKLFASMTHKLRITDAAITAAE